MRFFPVISLALAAAAFAAEQAAPASKGREGAAGGLDAVRRDFEAIKSARDGVPAQKGALPQLDMPALDTSSMEPGSAAKKKKQTLSSDKKSANWLVDAMMKEKESPENERDRELEKLLRPDTKIAAGTDEREAQALVVQPVEAQVSSESRATPPAVVNPLNSFLTDWMTPQDLALLKPSLREGETAARAAQGAAAASPVDTAFAAPAASEAMQGLGGGERTIFTAPVARENPYLQMLALPPPPSSTVFVPPVNTTGPVAPAPASPPEFVPPPSTAGAKVPDFVRPLPDEKYFKQLKRF